jgi:hypothetical protein
MKTWFAAVSAVAALTASTHAQPPSPQVLKSKGWFTEYPAACAEAKRTGKPLMVVFRCVP